PKVAAAQSAEQYRAAIDGLLAALGDPATRTVSDAEAAPPASVPVEPPTRIVEGMLVISCHGMGELISRGGRSAASKPIADYLGANPKGVVFDCRTRRTGADAQALYNYDLAIGLVDQMVSGTVTLAANRERQHSGYAPPQLGGTSSGYWSGLVTA